MYGLGVFWIRFDWICLDDTVLISAYTTNIYDELLYLDNAFCYNTVLNNKKKKKKKQPMNIQNIQLSVISMSNLWS